jgi:hypothetical protein
MQIAGLIAGLALWAAGPAQPAATAGPRASWRALRFVDLAKPHEAFRAADLTGRTRILMLWRADCGPCLIELKALDRLQAAAHAADPRAELVVVAMNGAKDAAAKLRQLDARPERQWQALGPDAEVLVAFNGAPPRLPLSVAIDARGRLCARRAGLLGTDIVKQWVSQCSS